MKIVLIGAGSFVFGPTVLLDALVKHRMAGELALVDLNLDAAQAMAGVGNRIARDLGVPCTVTATADRRDALPGADFVILSASPQGHRRWLMDYDILTRAGMPDQGRECAGLGGLSYALRTISMALDICEDMEVLCPNATLLDVTNPMPRVVSAVKRFTSTRVYGFCNVAQRGAHGYEWIAGLVGRPYEQLDVVTAGLNHFAWVLSVRDKVTSEDLLPVVERAVREGDHILLRRWLERYGAVAATPGSHVVEFLPFDPDAWYATKPPYHGDADERNARMALLRAIGAGTADWRGAFTHGSWEHPMDVAVALDAKATLHVPMLNLPNRGYLPDLPDGAIVEVPAIIENGIVRGVEIGPLPERVAEICRPISATHELVAEGAATGDRRVLEQAVVTDPSIIDKVAALHVLDEMIAAHRDLLPRIS